MKFVTRAVLLAIVLSSATECKSLKSDPPSSHCLDLCTGVWRACMTSCDHHTHCMECTISATECREKCLPRVTRQWRGSEINFFCFILILTELYLLLLPRCETFSANFSLSAFVLTCVELERIAKNQMYVFKIIELLSLSSSS